MTLFSRIAVLSAVLVGMASSANAVPVSFTATLSGANEFPTNASPGIGSVQVLFDIAAHTMEIHATFSGLLGTTTAAHIHCCTTTPLDFSLTAGVATTTPSFVSFPLGVTSGSFDTVLDMTMSSSYRAGFITANGGTTASAEAALYAGMLDGKSYFNIHTSEFGSGEIRDFLRVPEPATLALFGTGLLGLAAIRRRRKAKA